MTPTDEVQYTDEERYDSWTCIVHDHSSFVAHCFVHVRSWGKPTLPSIAFRAFIRFGHARIISVPFGFLESWSCLARRFEPTCIRFDKRLHSMTTYVTPNRIRIACRNCSNFIGKSRLSEIRLNWFYNWGFASILILYKFIIYVCSLYYIYQIHVNI